MLCTYCNTEFEVPSTVQGNLSSYGGVARIATPCCQQPFKITIGYTFIGNAFKSSSDTDDWGVPYKRDSLVGKYCLIKYDINHTHGVVCEIVEDVETDIRVKEFNNSLFRKSSILFIGSKEEIEIIATEHSKIEEVIKTQKEEIANLFQAWFKNFEKFKYSLE